VCGCGGERGVSLPACLQQEEELWETQVQCSLLHHDGEEGGREGLTMEGGRDRHSLSCFNYFLLCRKKPTSVIVYVGSGCSVATISVKNGAILGTVSSAGSTVSRVTFT